MEVGLAVNKELKLGGCGLFEFLAAHVTDVVGVFVNALCASNILAADVALCVLRGHVNTFRASNSRAAIIALCILRGLVDVICASAAASKEHKRHSKCKH